MAIYSAADVCVNPVRAFGPAFVSNQFGGHWVAWLGPVLGAVSGALCFQFIFCEKARVDEDPSADTAAEQSSSNNNDGPIDVESRPEKLALQLQQQHQLEEDKPRGQSTLVGRRSRVRPITAAANGEATTIFFNYNPADGDPDNLSLDGTKGGE